MPMLALSVRSRIVGRALMQREPRNARLARLPFVKLQVLGLMQILVVHVVLIAMHVLMVMCARLVKLGIKSLLPHAILALLGVRHATLTVLQNA
jgi:hypothetical protein